jgi:type II secretory pathway pseudopilin PulG
VAEVYRSNGRKVFSWFSWRMEELRKTHEGGFTLIELMAVITFLFHKQLS